MHEAYKPHELEQEHQRVEAYELKRKEVEDNSGRALELGMTGLATYDAEEQRRILQNTRELTRMNTNK